MHVKDNTLGVLGAGRQGVLGARSNEALNAKALPRLCVDYTTKLGGFAYIECYSIKIDLHPDIIFLQV